MRPIVIAGAALAALMLAGCSSNSPPAATSVPPVAVSSSVPVSSAAAAVWTTAEAGQKYLAMIAPANTDITAFKALPSSATVGQYTALAAKIAADEAAFATALNDGLWPASAAGKAQAAETGVIAERQVFVSVAQATSTGSIADELTSQSSVLTSAAAASEAMRIALGLPSN